MRVAYYKDRVRAEMVGLGLIEVIDRLKGLPAVHPVPW
jgi:hypothetical protein